MAGETDTCTDVLDHRSTREMALRHTWGPKASSTTLGHGAWGPPSGSAQATWEHWPEEREPYIPWKLAMAALNLV